ncbi:hypothetical protein [Peribacillus alkalitolerans]|uniref:hypothetical protein n=1 Tax=Peribacillus alkalitolerans TaxID=1550385 RepID=UPI0013D2BEC6|nr:hypothetical protein [Peribacillus alkalitolerans]
MKKKAIKIATASAIAASGFVAVAPVTSEAAPNIAGEVQKAKHVMYEAMYSYSKPYVATGELVDREVVYAAYKKGEAQYKYAVNYVNKYAPAKDKAALLADLSNVRTKYLLGRALNYIKSWNALELQVEPAAKALDAAVVLKDEAKILEAKANLAKVYDAQKAELNKVVEANIKATINEKAATVVKTATDAADKVLAEVSVPKVESVSAINSTQVKLVFNKEVTSANPANFTVTRKDDANIRQFVSKVEVSSTNKKEVTVTFADKLTADKAYEVVADGVMSGTAKVENSKAEFYYAKSVATGIQFTSTTVAPVKNIKDIVKVTDQLGRDITSEVELSIESSDLGIVAADGSTIDKGGDHTADKAIVKVTVKGTSVSTSSTIVTVSDATASTFVGYHIGADETLKTTADYKAKKAEDIVTSVSMGDSSKYLNMYYVDQYGKDTDARVGNEVTYTNLNPTVAVVGANGQITPISTGTALVKVKVGDLETTVNITVKASATPTTLEVSKTTVSAAIGAIPETFDVSFKDQFGKAVNYDSSKLSIKSADETIAKATTGATGSVSKVTYSVSAVKEGTTTFTVTYTDGSTKYEKVIPVTISKAGSLNSYKVEVDYTTLDLNAASTETTSDSTVATISVYSLDSNGNKLAKLDPNGGVGVSFVDETATNGVKSKMTLSDTADTLTLNSTVTSATTAKVAVKVGSFVVDTLTFDVKDTAAKASKVEFANNALPSLAVGDTLSAKVLDLVKLYDQYGKEITNKSGLAIAASDLIVTNSVNSFAIDGSGKVALTGDLKKDATADIVVTKITNGGDTTNLLSTPVVIKAVVKGDATAPVIAATYPKAGAAQVAGSKKVEVLVKSNENGKAYFLSVANDATAPTAAAVVAGASVALTANTEASQVLTLAADATAYDVYVVVEDAAGNLTAPVKVDVTTPAS